MALIEKYKGRVPTFKGRYRDFGDVLVAVSSTGTNRIAISHNGKTWRTIAAPMQRTWSSIAYSPKLRLWVIGSTDLWTDNNGNRIMTSTNGLDWTVRSIAKIPGTSVYFRFKRISWNAKWNRFIAVDTDAVPGYSAYSSDGINWSYDSGVEPNYIRDKYDDIGAHLGLQQGVSGGDKTVDGSDWTSISGFSTGPNSAAYPQVYAESNYRYLVTVGTNNLIAAVNYFDKTTQTVGYLTLTGAISHKNFILNGNVGAYSPKLNYFIFYSKDSSTYFITKILNNPTLTQGDISTYDNAVANYNWTEMRWCSDRFVMISATKSAISYDGITWEVYDIENANWLDFAAGKYI